jgi:hypothetical protein
VGTFAGEEGAVPGEALAEVDGALGVPPLRGLGPLRRAARIQNPPRRRGRRSPCGNKIAGQIGSEEAGIGVEMETARSDNLAAGRGAAAARRGRGGSRPRRRRR